VVVAPDLLRQPGFPRVALPVAAVASSLAHHALGLPVLLVAAAAAAGGLSATALALVPLLALQALLVLGPAFVLAAVHVRLRDTAHLVGVVLLPVFYATPVFYDAASLERVAWLRWINPMVHVVDAHRAALLRQEWPAVMPLLGVALAGLGLLAIGLLVYRRGMGRFLEHV
jgi:lipopolysaccharide transport system permease protein